MTLILGSVSVIISILCTVFIGMPYVMVGVLFFHISYTVALIIVYTKKIEWFNFQKMGRRIFILMLLPALSYGFYYVFPVTVNSFFQWISLAIIFAFSQIAILILYSIIFERKELKALMHYTKRIFVRKVRNSND